MSRFVDNVNAYITQMKIKKSFICMKSGIDASKLSRVLSQNQEINISEMEKISNALGKKMEYFLAENFSVQEKGFCSAGEMVFYAGEPKKEQEAFAKQLLELIENADEILSAKDYFMMESGEW